MPRSPRSTRPRSGRIGRSRPAGVPATAPQEFSARLLFTARVLPITDDICPDDAVATEDVAAAADDHIDVVAALAVTETPAATQPPTLPPPPTRTADPATRVHADRLVERSPRLELTPSQAVRLASDGRGVLTRRRPKAS